MQAHISILNSNSRNEKGPAFSCLKEQSRPPESFRMKTIGRTIDGSQEPKTTSPQEALLVKFAPSRDTHDASVEKAQSPGVQ